MKCFVLILLKSYLTCLDSKSVLMHKTFYWLTLHKVLSFELFPTVCITEQTNIHICICQTFTLLYYYYYILYIISIWLSALRTHFLHIKWNVWPCYKMLLRRLQILTLFLVWSVFLVQRTRMLRLDRLFIIHFHWCDMMNKYKKKAGGDSQRVTQQKTLCEGLRIKMSNIYTQLYIQPIW